MEQLIEQMNLVHLRLTQKFMVAIGAEKESCMEALKDFHNLLEKFDKEVMYLRLVDKQSSKKLLRFEAEMLWFIKYKLGD